MNTCCILKENLFRLISLSLPFFLPHQQYQIRCAYVFLAFSIFSRRLDIVFDTAAWSWSCHSYFNISSCCWALADKKNWSESISIIMSMSGKQNVIIRFVRDSDDTNSNCDLKWFCWILFQEFYFIKSLRCSRKTLNLLTSGLIFRFKTFDWFFSQFLDKSSFALRKSEIFLQTRKSSLTT